MPSSHDEIDASRSRLMGGRVRPRHAIVAAIVIGAAVAAFALGNLGALVVIIALVSAVAWFVFRQDSRGPVELATNADTVHRVLVLAHEGLAGDQLTQALESSKPTGRTLCVHVLVPALASPVKRLTSDTLEEENKAALDLDSILGELSKVDLEATGTVGDADPRLALEDALKTFAADEIVVVNPPQSEMGKLQDSATARAFDDVNVPVRELHVTLAEPS